MILLILAGISGSLKKQRQLFASVLVVAGDQLWRCTQCRVISILVERCPGCESLVHHEQARAELLLHTEGFILLGQKTTGGLDGPCRNRMTVVSV